MAATDDINRIFQIVDSDGSGFLDKEKLRRICPHLSSAEIDAIFDDLDTDHDQRISLKEFTDGFQDLIQPHDYSTTSFDKKKNTSRIQSELTNEMTPIQINEVFNNLSCQEQIYDFYETLRHKSSESTEQFQAILEVFVGDILKYRKEIQRLEDSYRREKEMNEKFLKRLEEDQEREMRQLEKKIRKEEQQKFEAERELIQQRASKQIADLQANVQRLQSIEQCYVDRQSNEDSLAVVLREEIAKLTQENQTLNSNHNDSLATIAILKSDLQSLKTQLNERQTMLLQEKQSSSINYREKESLQSNVRQLVEVNKKLRDENDALREIIDSQKPVPSASEAPPLSKRSMSRAGSILETYWNPIHHPRMECMSPSTSVLIQQQAQLNKMNSIDLESADELGILGQNLAAKLSYEMLANSSAKGLPVASTLRSMNTTDSKTTMNDSGLSLTTVRDVTEMESDRDSKLSGASMILRNSAQYRSMPVKRNNHESDSDEVFGENSFDRNHPKRWSQQRSLKRTSTIGRSSMKYAVHPALPAQQTPVRKPGEFITQQESPLSNLPFDRMYKVVFCGDAAVGKSTLIMRLCKGKFVSSINSTLGVDFQNKQLELDGKRVAIQLWDTAGQERFRSIAKSYFRRCDGVILVYDSTYERSFLNVREWIDTINESTPKKVSVMIVANKIDLRDQSRSEGKRVIERDDGAKLAKEYQALFIETSAKEGTNSNEALIELARDMQCNEDLERYRTAGIDLDKTTKKSSCCGGRS